jgi:hypothetical protein
MIENNRVEEQLRKWEATHPRRIIEQGDYLDNRLEFLERLKKTYQGTDSSVEKQSLARVDQEIKRAIQLLKPDFFTRVAAAFNNLLERGTEWFAKRFLPEEKLGAEKTDLTTRWAPSHLSGAEKEHKREVIGKLAESLRKQSLPGHIDALSVTRIFYNESNFKLNDTILLNGQKGKLETIVEKAESSGRYYATGYDLTTFRGITPEKDVANGVNIRDLMETMKNIPWHIDFSRGGTLTGKNATETTELLKAVNAVIGDLNRLLDGNDPAAKKIHDQLVVTHFLDTPNAALIPNIEELKRQFEHKIHVDLSPSSAYPLKPLEAMQLLNRGSINMAQDSRVQGMPWLTAHTQKDAHGYYQIQPIPGSEQFVLQTALAHAQVVGFPDKNQEEALQALLRGESVKVELIQNGRHVERFMNADPRGQRLATDWIRSENAGLFQRDEQLVVKLDEYRSRQQGTYVAPALGASGEMSVETAHTVQQPTLWKEEEVKRMELNRNNLANLDNQLAEMGVRPGVAKELLEQVAKSGENDLQFPYKLEFGQDKAAAQLRFKRDPELDWVYFQGYDMKVSFGNGQPAVNQRYYYNSEDPVNNYSLQEAYRMASGNAVSRRVGQAGEGKEIWRSLAFDQPLTPKGNHQINSVPFDLEKAIKEYPRLEELRKHLTPEYSIESIVDRARTGEPATFSIRRGNDLEQFALKVEPQAGRFSMVRLGEPAQEVISQQKQGSGISQASEQSAQSRARTVSP